MVLPGFLADPSCSGIPALEMPTAVVATNASGNGIADFLISPDAMAGFGGLTFGVRWQVWNGATLEYQTGCTTVTLD